MNRPTESKAGIQPDEILDASIRALSHRRPEDNTTPPLRLVMFSVELPGASRVQLAADFTDWDKFPLDMTLFDNGVWSTTVPLPAGKYPYRFLADGEWYDDRRALWHEPGAPGTAFVRVE